MATEETDPAAAAAKEQAADQWIEDELARLEENFGYVDVPGFGPFPDPSFGAGGFIDIGIIDGNAGAYDFPTWGGWGGGAGSPIFFEGDDVFGPGGIFGISPPPQKDKKPKKTQLDFGAWRKPGSSGNGVLQPGSKFEGGSNAPPPSVKVRPVLRDGLRDFRFAAKQHNRENLMPDFAGGTRTITLEGTDERRQQFQTYHADPRLVAANRGPSPSYGTPVSDVTMHGDLAGTRHAPLQSALRVVKSPRRLNKPGQTTDQAPAEIPNSLSLNIGTTGLGETLGLMASDNSYGRLRHARLTRADGGTWAIGPLGCKHRLGADGDNDPILPMHHPCESLFSWDDKNPTLDGPLAFNPVTIGEYAPRSGYTYRVDSCWDPGWQYVNGAATYRGAWAWRVQVPMGVTTPKEKPKEPPKGPKTPGGGDEPPKGPITPPGGPPQGPTTPSGGDKVIMNSGAFGAKQVRVAAGTTRDLLPRDHAAMAPALGVSAIILRPRLMLAGARDLAYGLDATQEELSEFERNAPAVLRAEAYGRQGGTLGGAIFGAAASIGPDFIRTQEPTKSTHRGGSANGGIWTFPPELGLEDVQDGAVGDASRPASTSFVGYGPGVSVGFGLPDIQSGGMKSGIGLAVATGDLAVSSYSSLAVGTEVLRQSATMTTPKVGFGLGGVLTPAQITGNVDDYAPTGLSSAAVLRLDADAPHDLTGITGGSIGRVLVLHNVGAETITLKDNTSSALINRFAFADGDMDLAPNAVVILQYDSTSQRWRAAGGSGGGGGTVVQAGTDNVIAAGGTTITFPVPFSGAPSAVICGPGWDTGIGAPSFVRVTAITANDFDVVVTDASGVEMDPVATQFSYIAREP